VPHVVGYYIDSIGIENGLKSGIVVLDAPMRARLQVFEKRDPNKSWSWFVQSTRRISEADFKTLTR
jgi:hypothetical protein